MKKLIAALSLIALVGCSHQNTKATEYQPTTFAGWQIVYGDRWQFALPPGFQKKGDTYYNGEMFVHLMSEDCTSDLQTYASDLVIETIREGSISLITSRAGHMSGKPAALLVFNVENILAAYDFVGLDGKRRAYHLVCTTAMEGQYASVLNRCLDIVKTIKF